MQLTQLQEILLQTTWPAPAKLNLFLHILGRYQAGAFQGYHQLQSVMQFLSFGDTLHFGVHEGLQVHLKITGEDVPVENNLILRAAAVLQQIAQQRAKPIFGIQIDLNKQIPIGGGLGGGSSDAATTLLVLNAIWGLDLSRKELSTLGLQLGADIAFFVQGDNAFVEGIGEQLTPIALSQPWFLVIHPMVSVSTPWVYQHPALTRNTSAVKMADYADGYGHNDCEAVVSASYPEVAQALTWLGQFTTARMTGSGACIFGRFDDKASAQAVLEQLPSPWRGFIAQGQSRSPLHILLDRIQASSLGV